MTAMDIYGHTYAYANGKIVKRSYMHRRLLFHYHYVANDGWAMIRHGEETNIHIEIGRNADYEELEKALKNQSVDKEARPFIRNMIKKGIKRGVFRLEDKL